MAQWLVIVPDIAGAQAKRLAVRAKHLEAAGTRYSLGGAFFGSQPDSAKPPSDWDFKGSAVVVHAESKEELITFLKGDVYYTSGVWDVDNAQL